MLTLDSDVLPWQCLTRYPEESKRVLFVDVDFPDLIERKRQTVLNTPELVGAFTGLKGPGETVKPVVLQTDQYVQIGCDLRDLVTFRKGLDAVLRAELAECEFIFVAEVSITYMETEGADGVIQWVSTLGNGMSYVLICSLTLTRC
jgi:Leucine carboxyl methyltransferase.